MPMAIGKQNTSWNVQIRLCPSIYFEKFFEIEKFHVPMSIKSKGLTCAFSFLETINNGTYAIRKLRWIVFMVRCE